MIEESLFDAWTALPTLWPAAFGLLLLAFVPAFQEDRRWLWSTAVAGMALMIVIPVTMLFQLESVGALRYTAGLPGSEMVRTDRLSLWLDVLFGVCGFLALLIAPSYLEKARCHRPELYPLIFLAVSGMTIMVGTDHLLMVFLGLEVLSISLYVMTGLARESPSSAEAALKYFLLGAFSTGFLVYGIALVYGSTGTFDLRQIGVELASGSGAAPFGVETLVAGLGLILVAFAFKVGLAPFHFWVPDVYQGAPTPVTAFMAAATKAAAFGVLIRILHGALDGGGAVRDGWIDVLGLLAAATMILGNVLALAQRRVKRLLAYSSVAHAGYITLGLIAPLEIGVPNTIFYLIVYAFMTLGAFAVVSQFQRSGNDSDEIESFDGLWRTHPWLAAAMGIFLLSMIGIPPLGGFTGKYVIFLAAIDSGHPVLASVMAVAAVVGAAYYLRVLVAMFFRDPQKREEGERGPVSSVPAPAKLALAISVAATLVLGLAPGLVLEPLAEVTATIAMLP